MIFYTRRTAMREVIGIGKDGGIIVVGDLDGREAATLAVSADGEDDIARAACPNQVIHRAYIRRDRIAVILRSRHELHTRHRSAGEGAG